MTTNAPYVLDDDDEFKKKPSGCFNCITVLMFLVVLLICGMLTAYVLIYCSQPEPEPTTVVRWDSGECVGRFVTYHYGNEIQCSNGIIVHNVSNVTVIPLKNDKK